MLGILGNGAIGSLLASKCHVLGIEHLLLCRNALPSLSYELIVPDSDNRQRATYKPISITVEALSEKHTFPTLSMLAVTTKAYDVDAALVQWRPVISPETILVLMNNGMGPHETVPKLYPENPIAVLTASYGALKPSNDQVKETGQGQSAGGWISLPSENIEKYRHEPPVQALFNKLLPVCHWYEDATFPLWQKLAINAIINPLTAANQVKNGELQKQEYQEQIHFLVSELMQILKLENQPFEYSSLLTSINNVITGTAENISSMYQDIRQQRKTEIDFITGYLLQVARRHGVSLPHHEKLYQQIKGISLP
ncbi:2-dehydropantoate 2-reductase [Paraneptunicella aestuarii]|uniref:ketopantoate reductase family protein n=1 Tax=Paraneptunicella aestuarii TaxID=2831148 RepID=UPI001E416337|nr:2-dehydropantoate 2-reductase [Paraneptunicella aestuarii]UAA37529.1 2-dehydropantoate 2-reductase [Paraneptunicella aestuarii]